MQNKNKILIISCCLIIFSVFVVVFVRLIMPKFSPTEDGQQSSSSDDFIFPEPLEPMPMEIKYLGTAEIIMDPNAEEHVIYPDMFYGGTYIVQLNFSDAITATVNGMAKTGSDLTFDVHMNEHGDIDIQLSSYRDEVTGTVELSIKETLEISSVLPNEVYLLRTKLKDIQTVDTGMDNLVIERIYNYVDKTFVDYKPYCPFSDGSSVTLPFDAEEDYYFCIRNTDDTTVDKSELTITGIQTHEIDECLVIDSTTKAIAVVNNYDTEKAFKFILPPKEGDNDISIYNSEGRVFANRIYYSTGETEYSFGLQAGETCYFFCYLDSSYEIKIETWELLYKWEVDGHVYNVNYCIALKKGATYNLRLYRVENGELYEVNTFYDTDGAPYYTFVDNVLTIGEDAPIGCVITIVPYYGFFENILCIAVL